LCREGKRKIYDEKRGRGRRKEEGGEETRYFT
jgi:hypothetical protein